VPRLLALDALLLVGVAVAILGVQVGDRGAALVDTSVRRYAAAVSTGNLDAAVQEIAPAERQRWRDWITSQLGNLYDVRGVAVRAPSLLNRLTTRGPGLPTEATVALDVNRGYPNDFYQAATRVPVEQVEGRWYLARPLLAPGAD
jgi:hypothetical protein